MNKHVYLRIVEKVYTEPSLQARKLLKIAQFAGLLALGIPLAAGKWGSYLGFYNQGLFLEDLLFFTACVITLLINPKILLDNFFLMLSIWFFIIFQLTRNPEIATVTKFRDIVPFIYLGFFQPISYLCYSIGSRRLIQVVRISTLLHLIWTSLNAIGLLRPISAPIFFGVPLFTTRWDQTGFVIAIGVVAWSGFSKFQLKGSTLIRFGFLALAITQGSRAGLLAFFVSLIWIFIHLLFWNNQKTIVNKDTFLRTLTFISLVSILILPVLTSFLPENSALGRIGILEISESAKANAVGTASGRSIGQQKLLDWVELRDQILSGVGPGVEMVYESGAFLNLSGSVDVRYPHSWPVSALARFGIFGTFFWLLVIFSISKINFKSLKHPSFAWIMSILITSIFGVIIESPFGSLPLIYFLCILRFVSKVK